MTPADDRPSRFPQQPRQRKGFNLVEAAIVLGVVGLVIGGIWVVAAEVRQKQRLSVIATSIGYVVEQTRILFKNMPAGDTYTAVQVDVLRMIPTGIDPIMVRNGNEFIMPQFSSDGAGETPIYVDVYSDRIQVVFNTLGGNDCILIGSYLGPRLRPYQIVYEGSEKESNITALGAGCAMSGDIIMRFAR